MNLHNFLVCRKEKLTFVLRDWLAGKLCHVLVEFTEVGGASLHGGVNGRCARARRLVLLQQVLATRRQRRRRARSRPSLLLRGAMEQSLNFLSKFFCRNFLQSVLRGILPR